MIFKKQEPGTTDTQVGGTHYKEMGSAQPWEVLSKWLSPTQFKGYLLGEAIAYLARVNIKDTPGKGGLQDIKKAHHTLTHLIEQLEK